MITCDDKIRLWKIFAEILPNFVKIPLNKCGITYSIKISITTCIFYGLVNYLEPINVFRPEKRKNN